MHPIQAKIIKKARDIQAQLATDPSVVPPKNVEWKASTFQAPVTPETHVEK